MGGPLLGADGHIYLWSTPCFSFSILMLFSTKCNKGSNEARYVKIFVTRNLWKPNNEYDGMFEMQQWQKSSGRWHHSTVPVPADLSISEVPVRGYSVRCPQQRVAPARHRGQTLACSSQIRVNYDVLKIFELWYSKNMYLNLTEEYVGTPVQLRLQGQYIFQVCKWMALDNLKFFHTRIFISDVFELNNKPESLAKAMNSSKMCLGTMPDSSLNTVYSSVSRL